VLINVRIEILAITAPTSAKNDPCCFFTFTVMFESPRVLKCYGGSIAKIFYYMTHITQKAFYYFKFGNGGCVGPTKSKAKAN
jgi:hypothetical protein